MPVIKKSTPGINCQLLFSLASRNRLIVVSVTMDVSNNKSSRLITK